jgi:hypothetical protein
MAPNTGWSSGLRTEIARALDAGDAAMTRRAIADAIGRHPSNLAAVIAALVAEGLVQEAAPPPQHGPGRRVKAAFVLSPQGRAQLEAVLGAEQGRLSEGDHVVLADASSPALFELLHVVGDDAAAARASWTCVLEGVQPERAFAFRGADAARSADDLMAVLAGARIASRHMVTSDLRPSGAASHDARRRSTLARRSRLKADTRNAGQINAPSAGRLDG